MRRCLLFSLLAFLLVQCASARAASARAPRGRKRIDTWLVLDEEKGMQRIEQYADMLHSLSVFGTPSKEFMDRCHQLHIEVYQGVSGQASSVDTPAHQQATIEKYVKACQTQGYDGIDLDFEHLDPSLQAVYSEFLRRASSALHHAGKKMSHCVGCYPTADWNRPEGAFYDPKVLAKTCDLIRVMCYDLYFAPGRGDPKLLDRADCQGVGPTSTYLWARNGMLFWTQHAPREKLVMGLPAYSNDYTIALHGGGNQVYASKPQTESQSQKTWQWYDRLNIYLYLEKDLPHLFYASDAESTKAHLQTVDDLNLPGFGFWHFSTVDEATWQAVRAWVDKK
jgi:spore germination protein YaaH